MTPNLTPAQALNKLVEGNLRFSRDCAEHTGQTSAHRLALLEKQTPFATVLTCSDSRISPEILFDRGLGDLFVTRTAGHTLDHCVLGSLEFGVTGLGTPLLLVMGHQSCGALATAQSSLKTGILPGGSQGRFIEQIIPSLLSPALPNHAETHAITREHTRLTLAKILDLSPAIAAAHASQALALVGSYYSFTSGKVEIFHYSDTP